MSPAVVGVKRAAAFVVGGVSAIVCVSAALHYWYSLICDRRRGDKALLSTDINSDSGVAKAAPTSPADHQVVVADAHSDDSSPCDDDDDEYSDEEQQAMSATTTATSLSNCSRGGRRDYRQRSRVNKSDICAPMANGGGVDFEHQTCSNASESGDDCLSSSEARATQLADEFSSKCQTSIDRPPVCADREVVEAFANGNNNNNNDLYHLHQHDQTVSDSLMSNKSLESPSGCDNVSEGSQDSGKGASTGLVSSMSPVDELIEIPPMYEFEVPQDIVGLLIGKKGMTIKWLTEESQAFIVIRHHHISDKHKICTLEGTREQINKCLRLIRRKFPPSRFPDLKLTPLLPPPVSAQHTPVWDNVVQLNLPKGVKCEVVVSSIISVGHFFLQQPTHPTFPSLARLDQYMLAVYSQPAGVPCLPRPIEAGVICAAPVLGGWYRAQTIEFYEATDEVLVKFVDYGGYSKVPGADIRQIRSDFMTLPFQATECYLANVTPTDDSSWCSQALAIVEQLTHGKIIEASVVEHSNDAIPLVELYALTDDNQAVSVNRLLVDSGYANWADAANY